MFDSLGCATVLRAACSGGEKTYFFAIKDDCRDTAPRELVGAIQDGFKLLINDYRRGDGEGALIFRRLNGSLHRMTGGHGYSSDWNEVTDAGAIEEVTEALAVAKMARGPIDGQFVTPED